MPRQRRLSAIPNVRFNIDCYKGKTKPCLIYAVFRYLGPGKPFLKYSTGCKAKKVHWDFKKQRVKNFGDDREYINEILSEIEDVIKQIFKEKGRSIKPDEFKTLIDVRRGLIEDVNKKPSLLEFIPIFLEEKQAKTTSRNHTMIKGHLSKLQQFAKDVEYFDFDDVDWSWRSKFLDWIYETGVDNPNMVHKVIATIKQFMTHSRRIGLHNNHTPNERNFNVKKVPTNKLVMYEEEIEAFYKTTFTKGEFEAETKERVRDLFIVGHDTLLRFSDFSRIEKHHIKEFEGNEFIEIIQNKTGEPVTLPVTQRLKAILEKYNYNLPKISNQKFNDRIKEAAKDAGFTEKIAVIVFKKGKRTTEHPERWTKVSSHMCRRSGATNLYLKGVPVNVCMKLTGHTTEKQFFGYVNIGNRMAANYMIEFYKKIQSRTNLKAI